MIKKKPKTCTKEDCDYPIYAKKLCSFHYKLMLSERAKEVRKGKVPTKSRKSLRSHIRKPKLNFNCSLEALETLKISELKRIADYWLRQYLLKTAKRNNSNQIYCPIYKRWYNESEIEVAHYIGRSNLNLRYDLDNVCLISKQSNTWDNQIWLSEFKMSKHIKDYSDYLGVKKVENLKNRAKEDKKIRNKEFYIEKIKQFKNYE